VFINILLFIYADYYNRYFSNFYFLNLNSKSNCIYIMTLFGDKIHNYNESY
jgi:hypothetical protein